MTVPLLLVNFSKKTTHLLFAIKMNLLYKLLEDIKFCCYKVKTGHYGIQRLSYLGPKI